MTTPPVVMPISLPFRAGRAEHAHGLALLHLKADIAKHFEIAEALGYADYVENLGDVSHCDSWWSDSNIRIPSQRPLLRMLESKGPPANLGL
jgi:hypothetical protein